MGSQPIRIQLGKILRENLVGQGGGEKANLRKALIGGNLAFGIGWWWANQSGSSVGKSCGKFLLEILEGKSCGKILGKSVGNFLSWMLIGYLPITQYVNLCKLSLSIKGRNIFENNQLCFGNWWGMFIEVFIEWTLILFTPVGFTPSVIKNCKSNLCN